MNLLPTTFLLAIVAFSKNVRASLTYEVEVSIRNGAPSDGTCQTPVWIGFHDGTFDVYDRDAPASPALERIAEDGNAGPLVADFANAPGGFTDGVVGTGPICPKETVKRMFLMRVPDGESMYVSYASMVLPSNDAFIANGNPMAHKVADEFGNIEFETFVVPGSEILDAGTEVNDEAMDTTAFLGQRMPNTGEDEGGVITIHPGFEEGGRILDNFPGADFRADEYNTIRVRVRARLVTTRVEVTVAVTNLAPPDGTCQTPVWIGLHDGTFDTYDRNEAATPGLERIAEDGTTEVLSGEFSENRGSLVDKVVGKEPICPGQSASARVRVDVPIGRPYYLNYASMVLPSNDAFIANGDPVAHPIFTANGMFDFEDIIVTGDRVLDAGTEINDEGETTTAFLGQSTPNTGDDENGVITAHPGFVAGGRILENFPDANFNADGYQVLRISASDFVVTRPYQVSIMATNNAPMGGTCQTPVWVGVHDGIFDVYNRAEPASAALERIAEDGTTGPISEDFASTAGTVADGVVGMAPICPGESAMLTLTVNVPFGRSLFFSYTSMVLPSNDAFIANGLPMAHRIFDAQGGFVFESFTVPGSAVLDAGTEVNDEGETTTAFLGQSEPNTGEDEDGVIELHPGFLPEGRILESFPAATFMDEGYETLSFSAMGNFVVQARLYAVTVTITNNAPEDGTCQTPVWVGFHNGMFDVYNRDEAASPALERIAEDGNAGPLIDAFASSMGTIVDGVVGAGAPICPGEAASRTFLVSHQPGMGVYFSYTSMILPSNDAFIANGNPMAHSVFDSTGSFEFEEFTVMGSEILDAGTEINDEGEDSTAFLGQEVPDTGVVENGVVTLHPGFEANGRILTEFPGADFANDENYETIMVTQTTEKVSSFANAQLRRRNVVPPLRGNDALANAKLRIFSNGDISFRLKFRGVEDVEGAGLYLGAPGESGMLVTSLFTADDLVDGPSGKFAVRGTVAQGAVSDMKNEMIWNEILNGNLFVQVATTANPDGELRGDLSL